jgi:hypothetical protein
MAERLKASRLITGVPVNRDVGSATPYSLLQSFEGKKVE